jgi:hypothetical protein
MKNYVLFIVATAITVSTSSARIGWTLEQCRSHYGHEVKVENAWCGGMAYGFIHEGLYIYAIMSADGRVGDITYFDNLAPRPLEPLVRDRVWRENSDGRVWSDALSPDWNARNTPVPKLGAEAFPHALIREQNGPTVLIENANHKGWQIRTMAQFLAEQKVISGAGGQVDAHKQTGT